MKKLTTLTLSAQGSNQKMEKGKVTIETGKQLRALRLKVTAPIQNNTGGNAALTDAQKQALLAVFLYTMRYGATGARQPYQSIGFDRAHREFRYASNSEIEGYNDTTTGLGKTVTSGATSSLVFYLPIPTGLMWWMTERKNFWGMGQSQAMTLELELRRVGADVFATNWAINGAVTIDVIPDSQPSNNDRWTVIPEYIEQNETDKTVRMPEGLVLRISERSAVHASSVLSNVSVSVGSLLIHDQVSAAELITPYLDSPLLGAPGLITDRETLVYALNDDSQFSDLPAGSGKVVQNSKDLATFLAGYLFVPIVSYKDLEAEIKNVAWNVRKQRVLAVSLATVNGWKIPDRLMPFVPFAFFTDSDPEFELYPGYMCAPGSEPVVFAPAPVLARAKQTRAAQQASGANRGAADIVRQLSNAVPGAVQSPDGYDRGSTPILATIQSFLGG